jgi:hypothetical protein
VCTIKSHQPLASRELSVLDTDFLIDKLCFASTFSETYF